METSFSLASTQKSLFLIHGFFQFLVLLFLFFQAHGETPQFFHIVLYFRFELAIFLLLLVKVALLGKYLQELAVIPGLLVPVIIFIASGTHKNTKA